MTAQETEPDLSMSVEASPGEVQVNGGLCRVGAVSAAVHAWDLLKEVPLSSLPPP